jgi:cytochrome c-type biogenesis protein CcmH/NrfF
MTKPYRLLIFLALFFSFASAAAQPSPTPTRQVSSTAAVSQATTMVEKSPISASTGDTRTAQVVWLFCGLLLILSILVIVFLLARRKPAKREP